MLQSCGVADLVATCFGGRNARCAAEFARRLLKQSSDLSNGESARKSDGIHDHNSASNGDNCGASNGNSAVAGLSELWRAVESELLHGQKLEGVGTCREVVQCLRSTESQRRAGCSFPLITRIHGIAMEGASLDSLFQWQDSDVNQ